MTSKTPRIKRIIRPRFSGSIATQPYSGTLSFRPRCRRKVIQRYIIMAMTTHTSTTPDTRIYWADIYHRIFHNAIFPKDYFYYYFYFFYLKTFDILVNIYSFLICPVQIPKIILKQTNYFLTILFKVFLYIFSHRKSQILMI